MSVIWTLMNWTVERVRRKAAGNEKHPTAVVLLIQMLVCLRAHLVRYEGTRLL